MDEIEGSYIYYTAYHEEIVTKGIEAINDYLTHASDLYPNLEIIRKPQEYGGTTCSKRSHRNNRWRIIVC